ncbi:MAG: DUF1206 domain-containing protein [Chloroflexota bacterium]
MQATVPARDEIEQVGKTVKDGAVAASPWLEGLGRFGYAAKGVVYLVVGELAVQAALGTGGQTTDTKGALAHIAAAPFGRSILVVLAVGLFGYAVWRLLQAVLDTERKGSELKGLAARAGYLLIASIYVALSWSAIRLAARGEPVQGSTQQTQDWTAWLLGQPLGEWLVGAIGAAVIANGLVQFYRASRSSLCDDLHLAEMSASQATWITRVGRAGYAARGVAFATIGGFLLVAAYDANPGEAIGLDGALATLAAQPFGPYLLGAVAAGLAAYGLFALVQARYRRMVIV